MKRCVALIALSSLLLSTIHAQQDSTLKLNIRDNDFKNIAFVAAFGGASHYNWVLSIVDELGARGHNITYITNDDDVRFGQPYSHVKTISSGSGINPDQKGLNGSKKLREMNMSKFFSEGITMFYEHFERDYLFILDYFRENKIQVAVCDHFAGACFEASKELNIPYIVTTAIDIFPDSAAPYINNQVTTLRDYVTEYQPFFKRFTNTFLVPLYDIYLFLPKIQSINKRKEALGISSKNTDFHHDNALKLINNLHGYSPPRPIGSHTEMVGPIIQKKYNPLTQALQNYLDAHERVAYVAFGQMATPSEEEIIMLLSALLESVESGTLDGFIWATVKAAGLFPDTITTSSGTIYRAQDIFDGVYPDILIVKWAPQTAILVHPSTAVFVSHGGLGSWYESMYAGTRMIMFPFFGDQPANSLIIERSHLGGIIDYDFTTEQAVALIKKVTEDKDGEIRKSVKRFQALTQIHSEHGIIRGADLVEEVAYTHVGGKLPHRESAERRMSYIKSHNIDLYAALAGLLYIIFRAAQFILATLRTKPSSSEKTKKQ